MPPVEGEEKNLGDGRRRDRRWKPSPLMWRPEDEAEEKQNGEEEEDDVEEEEEEEEVTSSPTPLARKGSTDARPQDDDDDDDEAPVTSPPLAPRLPPKIGSTGPAFGRNDDPLPKDGACACCGGCACD